MFKMQMLFFFFTVMLRCYRVFMLIYVSPIYFFYSCLLQPSKQPCKRHSAQPYRLKVRQHPALQLWPGLPAHRPEQRHMHAHFAGDLPVERAGATLPRWGLHHGSSSRFWALLFFFIQARCMFVMNSLGQKEIHTSHCKCRSRNSVNLVKFNQHSNCDWAGSAFRPTSQRWCLKLRKGKRNSLTAWLLCWSRHFCNKCIFLSTVIQI